MRLSERGTRAVRPVPWPVAHFAPSCPPPPGTTSRPPRPLAPPRASAPPCRARARPVHAHAPCTRPQAGDIVPKKKPDPAIYLLAARELRVEPGRCCVIEDSKIGLQAAKAAGMR